MRDMDDDSTDAARRTDTGDAVGPGPGNEDEDLPLRVRTYGRAGRAFVEAAGDVDLDTAGRLRDALTGACEAVSAADTPAGRTVVVDLRGVEFMDSAGMALLVRVSTEFLGRCTVALIVAENSQPAYVVGLCGLDRFVPVGHSPEELPGEPSTAAGPADPAERE